VGQPPTFAAASVAAVTALDAVFAAEVRVALALLRAGLRAFVEDRRPTAQSSTD